ncbi:hypothetical protein IEQ34_013267 [Dendrobium chrysotoxum]|uniref:Uncharacterized protein n=1 Tax=Dendrobium chrysotoxum TaxID=161865 RepID=A0AAV7GQY0_DENCH|nr:hypothetical protein IEQ34_013267 [Dendrobium chrysotoxum]
MHDDKAETTWPQLIAALASRRKQETRRKDTMKTTAIEAVERAIEELSKAKLFCADTERRSELNKNAPHHPPLCTEIDIGRRGYT